MAEKELLTVEDRVRLLVNALANEKDHAPVLRLFLPQGKAVWLITEADPDDPNRLFGLCDLGLGHPEIGYAISQKSLPLKDRSASQSSATPTSSETSLCLSMSRRRGQKAGS